MLKVCLNVHIALNLSCASIDANDAVDEQLEVSRCYNLIEKVFLTQIYYTYMCEPNTLKKVSPNIYKGIFLPVAFIDTDDAVDKQLEAS